MLEFLLPGTDFSQILILIAIFIILCPIKLLQSSLGLGIVNFGDFCYQINFGTGLFRTSYMYSGVFNTIWIVSFSHSTISIHHYIINADTGAAA